MDELGRGHPRLSIKGTLEVPGAHLGMPRKRLDRGILIDQYPLLHLLNLDRRLAGHLCREMPRELRLPAGTLQKQDQVPGDGQRQLTTKVFFDQRKRQIHACADTRGRAKRTVPDEDAVRLHAYFGVTSRQFGGTLPVRRDLPAVQQSGGGEKEGAGADRTVATDGLGGLLARSRPSPWDRQVEETAGRPRRRAYLPRCRAHRLSDPAGSAANRFQEGSVQNLSHFGRWPRSD